MENYKHIIYKSIILSTTECQCLMKWGKMADYEERIAESDKKIAKYKALIAKEEEHKRAISVKKREQCRKWRAQVVTAIGEVVIEAVGCDWTRVDISAIKNWLDGFSNDELSNFVCYERSPKEAKEALDLLKSKKKNDDDFIDSISTLSY